MSGASPLSAFRGHCAKRAVGDHRSRDVMRKIAEMRVGSQF